MPDSVKSLSRQAIVVCDAAQRTGARYRDAGYVGRCLRCPCIGVRLLRRHSLRRRRQAKRSFAESRTPAPASQRRGAGDDSLLG